MFVLVSVQSVGNAQSFSTPSSYPSVENPTFASAADFDGDGKIDLATPNGLTHSVTFAFNNGTGNFPSRITYNSDPNPGSSSPEALAVGDFNSDGKPDVAVGNIFGGPLSQGSIGILLNNGDRTFASAVAYSANIPLDVAVADVNADGKLDVVTASKNIDSASVLLGNGDGTFQTATTYPTAADEPAGICIADFNGDTRPDLAVTHYAGNVLSILLGNGNGTFQAPVNYPAGTTPRGILAKDLNGDNKQDIVVAVPNSSAVYVYIGNGNGTFPAAVPYVVGQGSDVAIGDLNGDGKDDIATVVDVGNSNNPNLLKVLRGNGDGTFQLPPITQNTRGGAFSSTIADFDNDGKLDIAIINPVFDVVDVYLNSPTAQGTPFNATVYIPATNVLVATFKDYDAAKTAASFSATINWGDGTLSSPGTISSNGSGGFNVNGTHTFTTPGPYNVAVQISDSNGNLAAATATATVGCGSTIVTNTNDSGEGGLRQTILGACTGSTITFAAGLTSGGPATITLTSGELLINKNLTISGPGAHLLSVSGNTLTRVFNVQAGTVVISGLAVINGRTTSNISGGGIVNRGALTLISCAIRDNSGANGGGGILNFADNAPATLTIINSTINGNVASSFGGGLLNTGNGGATVNLINSTVAANGNPSFGPSFGGGIYNAADTGTATLNITNSTIAGNRAGSGGGGIFNFGNNGAGTVNLNNSIVADNVVSFGGTDPGHDIYNHSGNVSGNRNVVESVGGTAMTGSNNSNVDPLLEKDGSGNLVLKNNGGPTRTLLPLHTSPAINNGSNAALPADAFDLDGDANTAEALPVDQRGPGFARIVNTTADIGAVETNYTITAIAGTPQSALINSAFAAQLQARVRESGTNISGFAVTFTAPASGATGSFSGSATVNTDASGIATAPVFTANGTAGGYNVVASLAGGSPSVNFSLANLSTISINDVPVTEGNSGTASLTFTVALAATSNLTVTVNYATANGTATTADNDYQTTSGTVTFNPGDLTKTVTVLVNGDQKTEPDETVFVVLSDPVNAAFSDSQGQGTIVNDDTLQLLLDTSGPDPNQLAALDSLLLIRDPFRVQNPATWFTSETNTRVILFANDLQLGPGESPSVVKITLVDGNGQPHEVAADDVRTIPNTTFTQVTFRLPDTLATGTCQAAIKLHARISNTGIFRIVP